MAALLHACGNAPQGKLRWPEPEIYDFIAVAPETFQRFKRAR